jgi:5-methylcytosine-specific restriction endonuclease McrA
MPEPVPLSRAVAEFVRVLADPQARREHELATMPYGEYLQTPEWRERRDQALDRAGYRCQVCNSGRNLHVHHRTYERRGRELPGDLTVLCSGCHSLFHGKPDKSQRPAAPRTLAPSGAC